MVRPVQKNNLDKIRYGEYLDGLLKMKNNIWPTLFGVFCLFLAASLSLSARHPASAPADKLAGEQGQTPELQESPPQRPWPGFLGIVRTSLLLVNKEWLRGRWLYFTTADGLSSNVVLSVAVQGDAVWFGTYGGGASCFEKSTGRWSVTTTKGEPAQTRKTRSGLHWENVLEDNHVTAAAADLDGSMWFGTTFYGFGDFFGVSRFTDRPKPKWTLHGLAQGLLGNDVTSIACEPEFVWVGTTKGLGRFTKRTSRWAFFSSNKQIPGAYINAVLVRGPEVWLGTSTGVVVFDKEKTTWKPFTTADGLPEDSVQALAYDGRRVWAGGTYGSLAFYSTEEQAWKAVEPGDGLADKWIKGMAADGKYLWVARDGGVSCLNIAAGKWLGLTAEDGLVNSRVNAVAFDGHSIWFGTGAGVCQFLLYPERKP